jgi:hypothetical protein
MEIFVRKILKRYWAIHGKAPDSLEDLLGQVEERRRGTILDAFAPALLGKRARYNRLFEYLREIVPPARHGEMTLNEFEATTRQAMHRAEQEVLRAILEKIGQCDD